MDIVIPTACAAHKTIKCVYNNEKDAPLKWKFMQKFCSLLIAFIMLNTVYQVTKLQMNYHEQTRPQVSAFHIVTHIKIILE